MASSAAAAESLATHKASKPKVAKALSLHLGLNAVNADDYSGWSGELSACEFDAHDMAALAKSQGISAKVLLTKKATRKATLAAIKSAAKSLKAGDFFFLSFSGHGGQVPDVSGEEADKQDETWCLYDGQLIDDELYFELSRFEKGVRILVVSDSCHSGTVVRAGPPTGAGLALVAVIGQATAPRPRMLPPAVARRTYAEHKAFYDKLQQDVARAAGKAMADPDTALAQVANSGRLAAIVKKFNPCVVLLSGCQDNQSSLDGEHNGAFTEQLLAIWNEGRYAGSYADFYARIRARMPASQSPNLFTLGRAGTFLTQQPFKV